MIIRRLTAHARLGTAGTEVELARERALGGDPDWQLWVQELDNGDATLMDMRVSVSVRLDDATDETIAVENHDIWMHLGQHPLVAAALVAEISGKDIDVLTNRLRARGLEITANELSEMYVSVELDEDLWAAFRPEAASANSAGLDARLGLLTENA